MDRISRNPIRSLWLMACCLVGLVGCDDFGSFTGGSRLDLSGWDLGPTTLADLALATDRDGGVLMDDMSVTVDDMADEPDLAEVPQYAIVAVNPFANTNDSQTVGSCNSQKMAQGFRPTLSGSLTKLTLLIKKVGAPQDELQVKVYEGGPGPEVGQLVATSDKVPGANLMGFNMMGPLPKVDFVFQGLPSLKMNSTYFFVLERTGAPDCKEVDVYRVGSGPNTYANGKAWIQWKGNQPADWLPVDLAAIDLNFEVEVQLP